MARRDELSTDELNDLGEALNGAGRTAEANEVYAAAYTKLRAHMDHMDENRFLVQKSIERIYRRNGAASFPDLRLNNDVHPSIEGHHLKKMKSQPAKYVQGLGGFSLDALLKDVVVPINFIPTDGGTSRPAKIPSSFDPQSFPLEYQNEIEIQVHVRSLVMDAIACMGCLGILATSMEFSFYGVTPDIVVICRGSKIVFVIEVKAPNRAGLPVEKNVFQNELVGGQIWLYLMSMKQAGVKNPLGAICTFNEIRLVSLDVMSSHPFDAAKEKLNSETTKTWEVKQHRDSPKEEQQPSPDPSRQSASKKSKPFDFEHPAESFDPSVCKGVNVFRAFLYGSETKGTPYVLPTLLLALTTAMIETEELGPSQVITEIEGGDDLGKRLFAFAKEDNLWFARTPLKLKASTQYPNHACKSFYLLDGVGRGDHGEVHLVVSTSGDPAAVKFYGFKPSRLATPDDREEQNRNRIMYLTRKRDEEWDLWHALYRDRKARKIQLAGYPCLLMPYGTRVSEQDRTASTEFIESELLRFCRAGYAYKESDLRWRHVLKDLSGKLFLADLGSLVKLKDGTDHSKLVHDHMTHLKAIPAAAAAAPAAASPVVASAANQSGSTTTEVATKRSATGVESMPGKKGRFE
ncbi:MAG: hypothetical protein SGILL_010378 [Bacillariaceae sp.]